MDSPFVKTDEHGILAAYLRAVIGYARLRLVLALLLLGIAGVTEGFGLLMLVPFLYLVGFEKDAGPGSFAVVAKGFFDALRLPLTLPFVLSVYAGLIALRAFAVRWQTVLLAEIEFGFVDYLRTRIYRTIGHSSWIFLLQRKASDSEHVLVSDTGRIGEGTTCFLNLLVTGFMALVYAAVALRLSAVMTLSALLTGGALSLLLWPHVNRSRELGGKLTQANRALFGTVSEFLGGIKLAKSYSAEERHAQAFERAVTGLRLNILSFLRMTATGQSIFQIGGAIGLAALFYLGSEVVGLPGPELLVFVLIFARLLPMFSTMQKSVQNFVHMLPAFASATRLEAECLAAAESPLAEPHYPITLQNEIRLENVSFRYRTKIDSDTLSNISLRIPAHRTTAVIGPSGAGKSTLADLLAGLIEPDRGEIRIDGQALGPRTTRLWRRSVAYVPQDTFLFHESVRANLLWARPRASEKELLHALRLAAAYEFVMMLPERLETVVGDRGIRISGGERQRLALARALLCKPSLLILDEATSALDDEHERRIQQAVEQLHGDLTIVLIAHRLSTIRKADHVVILEDGRVVEVGTRETLPISMPMP